MERFKKKDVSLKTLIFEKSVNNHTPGTIFYAKPLET